MNKNTSLRYSILYNFSSSDSENIYPDTETELELTWDDLEVANENLMRIQEHYDFYENHENSKTIKKKTDIRNIASKKDWYCEKEQPYCLKLKTDNDKDWQIVAPWCGHCERLNHISLIDNNLNRNLNTIFF